eukprot:6029144-Pyramimonas_sp.AAC.1
MTLLLANWSPCSLNSAAAEATLVTSTICTCLRDPTADRLKSSIQIRVRSLMLGFAIASFCNT